jgi:hypothetical protein
VVSAAENGKTMSAVIFTSADEQIYRSSIGLGPNTLPPTANLTSLLLIKQHDDPPNDRAFASCSLPLVHLLRKRRIQQR